MTALATLSFRNLAASSVSLRRTCGAGGDGQRSGRFPCIRGLSRLLAYVLHGSKYGNALAYPDGRKADGKRQCCYASGSTTEGRRHAAAAATPRAWAEISSAAKSLPALGHLIFTLPLPSWMTTYGTWAGRERTVCSERRIQRRHVDLVTSQAAALHATSHNPGAFFHARRVRRLRCQAQ